MYNLLYDSGERKVRMNLHDLSAHARAGRIAELNLISLEGGLYLLEARMEGRVHLILDEHGSTLNLRSVEHARDMLEEIPVIPFFWCITRCTTRCAACPRLTTAYACPSRFAPAGDRHIRRLVAA